MSRARRRRSPRALVAVALALTAATTACAPRDAAPADVVTRSKGSRCPKPAWATQAAVLTPARVDPGAVEQLETLGLSTDASWVAAGLGLAPLLVARAALFERERAGDVSHRLDAIELDQLIDRRISIVGLDVSSLAATIECHEERWEEEVTVLEREVKTRETWLTVSAIALGALAGVASGALQLADEDTPSAIVGISGSAGGAVLSAATLLPGRRVHVVHEGSLLSDLWTGAESSVHAPRPVWLFLTATPPRGPSLRDQLVGRLRELGRLGARGSDRAREREALFFGAGGDMNASDLRTYVGMLDEVESLVMSINGMLTRLFREVDAWRDDLGRAHSSPPPPREGGESSEPPGSAE